MKHVALALIFVGAATLILWGILQWLSPGGPVIDMSQVAPPSRTPARQDRLRFAIATMVSPQETFVSYKRLVELIGRKVGLEGGIVLRPTYKEVRLMLEQGSVDVAFVCTGTYLHGRETGRIELLAQPVFTEGLSYRCVLIIPKHSPAKSLEDLAGKTMAFTDPESNTGYLVPCAVLINRGHDPEKFFGKIVITGSHDRSIQAVANGMVDAAAVDSLVFYAMKKKNPALSEKVRVIWQSEPFGPPAIVVPAGLDKDLKSALQEALLRLHETNDGREALTAIGIEKFHEPHEADYNSAYLLFKTVQNRNKR